MFGCFLLPKRRFRHKITIWRKESVRLFGPLMDGMIVHKNLLPILVRETAINANHCCNLEISPDDYLKPYLKRSTLIKEITEKNDKFTKTNYFSTISMITNPSSLHDFVEHK